MPTLDKYKSLITQYQIKKFNSSENIMNDKEALLASKKLINSARAIEENIVLKFPEEYLIFIEAGGLRHFESKFFQIFLYDERDIVEFNRGDSSYPELQNYLLFGQDDGSYSYFFDVHNNLEKGVNAIYRIDRGLLSKEYFLFVAQDFLDFFQKLLNNETLSTEYCFKQIDSFIKSPSAYNRIKSTISEETIQELNYYRSIFKKLDGHDLGYNMNDEDFTILDEIEKSNSYSISLDYKVFLSEFRGGTYWSKSLFIDFYADDGLFDKNLNESNKTDIKHKDFFIFATTDSHQEIYFDPNNKIGHGRNAVYITSLTSQDLSKGVLLAESLRALFEKLANDK